MAFALTIIRSGYGRIDSEGVPPPVCSWSPTCEAPKSIAWLPLFVSIAGRPKLTKASASAWCPFRGPVTLQRDRSRPPAWWHRYVRPVCPDPRPLRKDTLEQAHAFTEPSDVPKVSICVQERRDRDNTAYF